MICPHNKLKQKSHWKSIILNQIFINELKKLNGNKWNLKIAKKLILSWNLYVGYKLKWKLIFLNIMIIFHSLKISFLLSFLVEIGWLSEMSWGWDNVSWSCDVIESRLISAGLNAIGVLESFFFIAGLFTSFGNAIQMSSWVSSLISGLFAVSIDSWDGVWCGGLFFCDFNSWDCG